MHDTYIKVYYYIYLIMCVYIVKMMLCICKLADICIHEYTHIVYIIRHRCIHIHLCTVL